MLSLSLSLFFFFFFFFFVLVVVVVFSIFCSDVIKTKVFWICACLDLSVSSSSWCLGRAAVCDPIFVQNATLIHSTIRKTNRFYKLKCAIFYIFILHTSLLVLYYYVIPTMGSRDILFLVWNPVGVGVATFFFFFFFFFFVCTLSPY